MPRARRLVQAVPVALFTDAWGALYVAFDVGAASASAAISPDDSARACPIFRVRVAHRHAHRHAGPVEAPNKARYSYGVPGAPDTCVVCRSAPFPNLLAADDDHSRDAAVQLAQDRGLAGRRQARSPHDERPHRRVAGTGTGTRIGAGRARLARVSFAGRRPVASTASRLIVAAGQLDAHAVELYPAAEELFQGLSPRLGDGQLYSAAGRNRLRDHDPVHRLPGAFGPHYGVRGALRQVRGGLVGGRRRP